MIEYTDEMVTKMNESEEMLMKQLVGCKQAEREVRDPDK